METILNWPIWQQTFLDIRLSRWFIALLIVIIAYLVGRIIVFAIQRATRSRQPSQTQTTIPIFTPTSGQRGQRNRRNQRPQPAPPAGRGQISIRRAFVSWCVWVGVGISISTLPLVGFIRIWAENIYLAIIVGISLWLLIRGIQALASGNRPVNPQNIVSARLIMFAYTSLSIGLLAWFFIQWPISCLPDCTSANLTNITLRGLDLSGINLIEANLKGADLTGANLENADLSGALLDDANLQGANLAGAVFIGANLSRADLRNANLEQTDFTGAILNNANLTRSDLTNVALRGATFTGAALVEVNMTGANLSGSILTHADLTGANLAGVNFAGASLSAATLSGAVLNDADLSGAFVNRADISNASLINATLSGGNFIGTRLSSANLTNAQLQGSLLIGTNLSGANLQNANLTGALIFPSEFLDRTILRLDSVLASLNQLQLSQTLITANLSGVVFDNSTVWPPNKAVLLRDRLGEQVAEVEEVTPTATPTDTTGITNTVRPLVRDSDLASLRGNIALNGSPDLLPVSLTITNRFRQEGYGGQINLESSGTDSAFNLLCNRGTVDLIYVTRYITNAERNACNQNQRQPVAIRIGTKAAYVVVTNPLNTFLSNLTVEELQRALTATRWTEVNQNFPAQIIHRFLPEPNTEPFDFVITILGRDEDAVLSTPNTQFDANYGNLVWNLLSRGDGIAIIDYEYYLANQDLLRAISVGSIAPELPNIEGPNYLLTQPFVLYADLNSVQQRFRVLTMASYYLDTVSPFLEGIGYTALSPDSLAAEKQRLLLAVGGNVASTGPSGGQ